MKHAVRTELKNVRGRDPITALYESIKKRPTHVDLDLNKHMEALLEKAELEAKLHAGKTGQTYVGVGKTTVVVPVQNPETSLVIVNDRPSNKKADVKGKPTNARTKSKTSKTKPATKKSR